MQLIFNETTIINAPIGVVRSSILNVESWSKWNNSCKSAEFIHGSMGKPGSKLAMRVSLFPFPIYSSTIFTIIKSLTNTNNEMIWEGKKLGVYGIHKWQLDEINPNKTRMQSLETLSGNTLIFLGFLGIKFIVKKLNNKWSNGIKNASEESF